MQKSKTFKRKNENFTNCISSGDTLLTAKLDMAEKFVETIPFLSEEVYNLCQNNKSSLTTNNMYLAEKAYKFRHINPQKYQTFKNTRTKLNSEVQNPYESWENYICEHSTIKTLKSVSQKGNNIIIYPRKLKLLLQWTELPANEDGFKEEELKIESKPIIVADKTQELLIDFFFNETQILLSTNH